MTSPPDTFFKFGTSRRRVTTTADTGDRSPVTFGLLGTVPSKTDLRVGLSLTRLRGMAFDGASNMAAAFNGAQALLRKKQPRALYVHCGAHCANLVAKVSCEASMVMRKALHAVNELGVLFGESINLRNKFDYICVSGEDMPTTAKLRPLSDALDSENEGRQHGAGQVPAGPGDAAGDE